MNLLILDQFSDPGGAQRCLLDLLPAIRAAGWNALVGLPGEGSLFAQIAALGFPTARIACGPYASGRKSLLDLTRFLCDTPTLSRQIAQLSAQARADLIYLNGPRLLPAAALCRPKQPVLFHSHSLIPAGAMRRLTGASLRLLHASVVGSCRFVADPWRRFVPEVSVVYNGVAGPASRAPRNPNSPPCIGCIGRIAPEKGQLAFLAAARLILASLPDCRFLIFGAALFGDSASHAYEAELRQKAAGLPIEFAGWTSNVYDALAQLDLVLVPSASHEATTRVILEAYAAAVPVVSFASGGIPEVVTPGTNGFLAHSVQEMAHQAISILQAPTAAIGTQARETWQTCFTLQRYQRQMLEAIRQAASPNATQPLSSPIYS